MADSNPNIESIFTDVANMIREKKGTSEIIYPVKFADEIATISGGGGDQPQLHAVTGLSQAAGVATWAGDSYTESYKLYLDSMLIDTVTTAYYDLAALTVSVGSHIFGVAASATNFIDATPATLSVVKSSITVNVTDGTYSGPSEMLTWESAQITITPNTGLIVEVSSVMNAGYSFDSKTNILTLSNPTGNVTVNIECRAPSPYYVIGFSGAAQSTPALTRTDSAEGATFTTTDGVIEFDGIEMNRVWGGYIGNDEEELTWDATSGKFLYNGAEYTGNVFTKINRFYTKASYVEVSGEQVLDGYQLLYTDIEPDDTWQDWFLGKPYTKIGCYKARGGDDWTNGLQSKQGLSGRSAIIGKDIATASNLNSSTTSTVHMKWYNQNSILQVLFMALFATRQTEDVFPRNAYRWYNNTQNTGYLDEMRTASTCATGYSTSKTGNMFLGIEDFVGYSYECLGGVQLITASGNISKVHTTLDYDTFDFANTYTQVDITIPQDPNGSYIKSLQECSSVPGLLLPKMAVNGKETTYYCDMWYGGGNYSPIYQGAHFPGSSGEGIFCSTSRAGYLYSSDTWGTRLCGEPL